MLVGGRNLENEATPFFLESDPLEWSMALREAAFVTLAAKLLLYRLGRAAQGRSFKLGSSFKKSIPVVDDADVVVEFGLQKGQGENDPPAVYLRIDPVRVCCSTADGHKLIGALMRYEVADELSAISGQPQQLNLTIGQRDPEFLPAWARDWK